MSTQVLGLVMFSLVVSQLVLLVVSPCGLPCGLLVLLWSPPVVSP